MDSAGSVRPHGGGQGVAGDSIVLEEEIDQNYVPSEEEVREYAKWLGMELGDDGDLFWIAKEGLKAPLPENWKPCKTVDTDEIYYFNFATGESTWDHPCDEYYRKLYEEEKKKKMTKDKAKHDKSKQQAKKDVSQLLGKDKKKKGRTAAKRSSHQPSPERIQAVSSPSSSIFDRKPLPGTAVLIAEHEALLRELREEHARDLDALEQAHNDAKSRLESDHRRDVASKKRQWAASAETEHERARDALNQGLEETRAKYSREIDELESRLLDTRERLKKAIADTEEASEAARTEKATLESTLSELKRQVIEEKNFLREAREAARKVQGAEASQSDDDLRRELTRVISDLENERKHVAELERQLKEANNGEALSLNERAAGRRTEDEESAISKIGQLQAKLERSMRDNERLRKEAARVTTSEDNVRRGNGVGTSRDEHRAAAALLEHEEANNNLRKTLEENKMRLSELQRAKDLSVQDGKDAAAALVDAQERVASLELDNKCLMEQIARHKEQDGSTCSSGASNRLLVENAEKDAANRQRETEELRADLEAARNEVVCYAGEVKKSKELEAVVRDELHTAQLALRQSELKVAELGGKLATVEHEKALSRAAAEELRLENARLKGTMEGVHSAAEGNSTRDVSDALVRELKELKTQLAALAQEREGLHKEVGSLKQQLVSSEGVHKAERGMFDSSLASKERHVESLQTTVKRLEAELLAGQRREEALHAAAKVLRETVASSKLEAWRLKEKLNDTAAEAERIAADLERVKQENTQRSTENESGTVAVSATDVETAKAETQDMAARLKLAEEQVGRLQDNLQETSAKLVDSQKVVTSVQLSSERAVSSMVSKDEFDKARAAEKETAHRLEEALYRCTKAEESLAQACDDRLSLEAALRDVERSREARPKDALSVLANESRDATSQTSVSNKEYCDLERKLLQSHEDLESARTDLASSKYQTSHLQQQLLDLNAGVDKAMQEARQNSELASTRQQEIISISEREQAASEELRQVRISLKDAEKDRERAFRAAEQAKHDFTVAESGWRREAEDLRAALNEALARDGDKHESNAHSEEMEDVFQPSTAANGAQSSLPQQSRVAIADSAAMPNERPQPSTSGMSDTTSLGLAEELMQKLTDETKQRRSTRQALSDKASRSWTKKLNEERRMLALAKEAVKHHKERVKKRQQRLLLYQARWRDQRRRSESSSPVHVKPRHGARQTSLEDAKRELDSEVHKLNKFVKQLRSSKNWLDQRERKIFDFETLLGADPSGPELKSRQQATGSTSGAQSSSPESSSAKLHSLEAMQQELDNDLSDYTASRAIWGSSSSRPMPLLLERGGSISPN
eukprot:g11068.t1